MVEAFIPDPLSDDIPVLLLNISGVVLLVWPAACECQLVEFAEIHQVSIDELASIVRVNAENLKWEVGFGCNQCL